MSLELRAVAFNIALAGGALNVRRNAREPVAVPEISADRPSTHQASACYTLARLAGGTTPIQVHLRRVMPETDRVEVRALAQPIVAMPLPWSISSLGPALAWPSAWALAYWSSLYAYLDREAALSVPGPVGGVNGRDVVFGGAADVVETFTIDVSAVPPRGVGVHPVRWRWQFRRNASDEWSDFGFTHHRMYVLLSEPTLPWRQVPNLPANTQLPWLDVLDLACRWAAGATTREQAAARVTEAIYRLGEQEIVAYDCAGPGSFSVGTPHYTVVPGIFDCTRFVERARGGLGNGPYVNCSDCASAVATFSNILGCDLSQARMFGAVPFPLNPTRGIGTHNWLSACSVGSFTMHEVAWTGACLENDDVYDACLAVDNDRDPTRAPHTPLLPAGLRFGAPGQGLYRDRLAAPAGRATCQPQPAASRQRRVVI